jgi:LuxR family transcriptional regulator, maltose regulon positive regulatory protein
MVGESKHKPRASDAVLTTKLFVPETRPTLVPRPRLMTKLDEGLGQQLTLVSATAGFGKTTLLSEWASRVDRKVAWLSLDEGDNEPVRFLAHLTAALQTVQAEIGETVQASLQAGSLPPLEPLLASLINDLARSSVMVALVLDDYHLIASEAIHQALAFFVEHLPPQLSLIIASRVDPPLPLSRLRGQAQLCELRTADLRFTAEEAERFLNERMGLCLAAGDIAALESRTEGWIVGLQLAALSLQGEKRPAAFIKAFAGDNRYVIDYLLDEVFARQSQEVQSFLLRTAILERLYGPLCDALLAHSGSQALLEALEQSNLFVIPLDSKRRWYRYHHLFGDLLRYRLQLAYPQEVAELHRRAAAWYEQERHHGEALNHLFTAGELERAASLIERAGLEALWERGEVATLSAWLRRLPEDLLRSRPRLLLLKAWTMHLTGKIDAIEPLVHLAEGQLQEGEAQELFGEAATLRAFVHRMRGDLPRAIELAYRALKLLPEEALRFRGLVSGGLAEARYLSGDVAAAGSTFAEASELCLASNSTMPTLFCLWRLADVQILQGRLHQAAETCERMRQIAARPGSYMGVGFAAVVKGRLLAEWNELKEASQELERGIERGKQVGNPRVFMGGYAALARVLQAEGKLDEAHDVLDEAEALAEKHGIGWTWGLPPIASYKARLSLISGDARSAARWLEQEGLRPSDEPSFRREADYFTLVRVLIAEGRLDEALELLGRLFALAQEGKRDVRVLEALILKALALQARGSGETLAVLKRALALAEPEGYIRLFTDEGAPMQRLLKHALRRGFASGYVTRLLAAFEPAQPVQPSLAEPLNDR